MEGIAPRRQIIDSLGTLLNGAQVGEAGVAGMRTLKKINVTDALKEVRPSWALA